MPLLSRNLIAQIAAEEKIEPIVKAVSAKTCVLFLGSGVHYGPPAGSAFTYPSQDQPPVGTALSKAMAEECKFADSFPDESATNWQRVAMCYEIANGREALVKRLNAAVYENRKPSRIVRALAELPFPVIVTTNYDQLFETALRELGKKPIVGVYDKSAGAGAVLQQPPTEQEPFVYKIHGDIKQPASIVITDDDYIDFVLRMNSEATHPVPLALRYHLQTYTTLFVGFSFIDYNLRLLFKTLRWRLDPAQAKPFYSVDPFPDPLIFDVWCNRNRQVTFLAQNGWTFVPSLYEGVLNKKMT